VRAPFVVERPEAGREAPVVVEVPHAGLEIDGPSAAFMLAPVRSMGRDADLYVDDIFSTAPSRGATLVRACVSRFVVDLNRAGDDVDAQSAEGGTMVNRPRGLIWRTTTDGDPILTGRLPASELARRRSLFYEPYHRELTRLLEDLRARFGFAVLLCAHSMPSTGRRGHVDVGVGRADIVPGSRGRSTAAPAVIDAVEEVALAHGYSVRHDDPYQGGFSTGFYGRPAEAWHAVQVEIARRVYMDEDSLAVEPAGLARARGFAEVLVRKLGAWKGRP
jgi:N-formylglutamate amidohydrolase